MKNCIVINLYIYIIKIINAVFLIKYKYKNINNSYLKKEMAEEYQSIKGEKELIDSQINDKEIGNSSEVPETDNKELYSAPSPNLDITNKMDNDENMTNDYKESYENIIGENEDEYIAVIEGLENELLIEQHITKSLKNDTSFNEEVNKLKSELNNKNTKLEQLKSINKKQENTLIEFKNKLKKEVNKKAMNNKVIINSENINLNYLKEVSKNEAINNAIKIKDSALMNVINKMNLLKKENEELKKKIYQNESSFNCSHVANPNYEDSSQKNMEKIKFLQNEIKMLNKQLIEHNRCIEEQNTANKEYNSLKNELRLLKINNQDIKNKIKEFEKKILNIEINDINNNSLINYNTNNLTIRKKNPNGNNIGDKRQSSVKNSMFSRTTPKSQKLDILPIISIQPLVPNTYNYINNQNNNKSILSDDFIKKIKKYFNNNEKEFLALINKIHNIEKNGNNAVDTNNNFYKLRKYNTQLGRLDKNKMTNLDGKEGENNQNLMNYKYNTLNDENKLQNKKIEDLQKQLSNMRKIGKEKDNEISTLLNKITQMKNALKISDQS